MSMNRWTRGLGLVGLLVGLVAGVGAAAGPDEPAAARANAGWEEMGGGSASGEGISDQSFLSRNPALAVGPGGPLVAWWDNSASDGGIYVRRWDGAAWVRLDDSTGDDDITTTSTESFTPSIAVGPANAPIVAWEEQQVGEIYARQWNGTAWVALRGPAADGGISANAGQSLEPQVAITPAGPIIVWQDDSQGNWEIYVRRWDGAAWVEMGSGSAGGGGISNNSGGSAHPVVAVAPDGTPFIAWSDGSNTLYSDIFLRRWDGAAWVEVGGSASGGGVSQNGGSWAPALDIDPSGAPIVAYVRGVMNDGDIHARRWDGAVWVDMGEGVSNNDGQSWWPVLAVNQVGAPIIAWMDDSSGQFQIYVRRWDGTAWVEFDSGSATAGGISETPDYSGQPSLAIAADGRAIVAWHRSNSEMFDDNIYVRQSPAPAMHLFFIPTILHQPFLCFAGPDEQEDNDDQAQANGPLCNGQSYRGRPDDNYDVFSFVMVAAGPVTIELNDFAAGGGQLGLLSADFVPIAYDLTPGDGFRISRANEPAGGYYIVVHTPAPDVGAGQYALRATWE